MKRIVFVLLLSPLFGLSQTQTNTILKHDIYSERPVGIKLFGKSPLKMECGGQPTQSAATISLRCSPTITANSPMFVVDDCIVTGFTLTAVNPNDIESIEVLKNAVAIEKYGAGAKNGVIKIKTKNKVQNSLIL